MHGTTGLEDEIVKGVVLDIPGPTGPESSLIINRPVLVKRRTAKDIVLVIEIGNILGSLPG